MSLLGFDGMQDHNAAPKSEWSGPSFNSTTGRDGSTNGAMGNTSTGGSTRTYVPAVGLSVATVGGGFAWQNNQIGLNGNGIGFIVGWARSGTTECVLICNATGFLELRRTSASGTLLATSSGHTALTTQSVWHSIQYKVSLHTSTGNVEIKLNGVTVLNFTGATAGTIGNVTAIQVASPSNSSSSVHVWDDWYVWDTVDATATQGRPNNDFLGDLRIASLFPTAAGDSTQWTPSTGANYTTVDEVPPNTTDYVATSTSTNRDLYNITDLPAATGTVFGLRLSLWAVKTDAGAASIKPVVKENSTTTAQTAIPLSTSYVDYEGAALYVKPSSSAVWAASDVNATQVGVELA